MFFPGLQQDGKIAAIDNSLALRASLAHQVFEVGVELRSATC